MAAARESLYQVLGLNQSARTTDIEFAYKRFRSQMQREDVPPDPKRAALAKFAYDTLTDPARRAQYDASLDKVAPTPVPKRKRRRKTPWAAIVGVVLVAAIAAGAFLYMRGRAEKAAVAAVPTTQQMVEDLSGLVGRVQGTLMSGEARPAGLAVATATGEMVTTCHDLPPGAQLSVFIGGTESRAEVLRANTEIDICTLAVKDVRGEPVKMKAGEPSVGEKVLAMVLDGARTVARPGRVVRSIADPNGAVFELDIPGPAVPTGAAVMDLQGRLVGIVTTPHAFGEAPMVALGTARIARSRTAIGVAPVVPTTPSPATAAAAAVPLPGVRLRRSLGEKVDEGFANVIEVDEEMRMVGPVDSVTRGRMGDAFVYWTKWKGRDTSPHEIRCVVTFHEIANAVVDVRVKVDNTKPDGYYWCAFDSEGGRFFEGTYRFIIFIDDEQVSEGTLRIEKRFLDRLHLTPLKIVLAIIGAGIIAFGWLRRKRSGDA